MITSRWKMLLQARKYDDVDWNENIAVHGNEFAMPYILSRTHLEALHVDYSLWKSRFFNIVLILRLYCVPIYWYFHVQSYFVTAYNLQNLPENKRARYRENHCSCWLLFSLSLMYFYEKLRYTENLKTSWFLNFELLSFEKVLMVDLRMKNILFDFSTFGKASIV